MTNKIIEAARAAGFSTIKFKGDVERIRTVHSNGSWVCCTDSVAALYAIARAEALEDAAKAAEAQQDLAEQEKADKRFKAAMKDLEAGKATERNAVDRGDHWMCVATCNAVLRNAAKAIRSLKEQQHG